MAGAIQAKAEKVAVKAVTKATPEGRAAGTAVKVASKSQTARKVAAAAQQRPAGGRRAGGGGQGRGGARPAVSQRQPAARSSNRSGGFSGGRGRPAGRGAVGKTRKWLHLSDKALFAEFLMCVLLLLVGGMTGSITDDAKGLGSTMAVRGTGIAGVFVVLGLVSSGGPTAKQLAAGFGAIVTLSYMIADRKVISAAASYATKHSGTSA